MDTHDRKVIDILSDQKRFIVPFYQRHYKWDERLWQSFWEDVLAKAEELQDGRPKFDHYMGALILAPESYSVAVTPRLQIIDGQQRLTTFQLFLVALRGAAEELGISDFGAVINNYLFNRPMTGDTAKDSRFKLSPNRADREVFYNLIDNGVAGVRISNPKWFFQYGAPIKKYAPNNVRAVHYFESRIREYAKVGYVEDDDELEVRESTSAADDVKSVGLRLHTLMTALMNHLKLVVITLGEGDDAQVIFETLNSKSEPLTAMELVRNYVFQRAAAEGNGAEELFETRWQPLETAFWNETAPRARPRRPRIDHFLSHALTAQTGEETSLRELYAEYRAFARPKGAPRFPSVSDELEALLRYVEIYRGLEGDEHNVDLSRIGEQLQVWEVTTAYPVVFAVAASDASATEKRAIYDLLNSYLVRRAICGLTPKNLNKTFQRLVSNLLKNGVSVSTFCQSFANQQGNSVRFPDDEEFSAAIGQNPVYLTFNRKDRLRELLWCLECEAKDKFAVTAPKPSMISIEHVMPQRWIENWPLRDGTVVSAQDVPTLDEPTAEEVRNRNRTVHTLGNLTLVTVSGNSAASNSGYAEKRQWLEKSLLAMNQDIAEQASWTEREIANRGARLAKLAINMWPAPSRAFAET